MPTILAIDDKSDNLITMSALLKTTLPDTTVQTAMSGQEGITKAKATLPDVILLDVVMPEMDGYEVCQRLRADSTTKHIPILMLTALESSTQSRIKGLQAGADAFLTTPVDEGELCVQVNVMLRIRKAENLLLQERDLLKEKAQNRAIELEKTDRTLQSELRQRKETQHRLDETTHMNQILLDAMPCVALLVRSKTREIVAMNETARQTGAVLGKSCFNSWARQDDPCPWCLAPEAWATGKVQHLEVEALDVIWDAHWQPISDDLYLHYAFDITERKKAHEEIERLAKFPSENPNPVLRINKSGSVLYANAASSDLLKLWGCEEDKVLPDHWCDLISEAFGTDKPQNSEVECGDTVYSLSFAPVKKAGFVNVYGLDITGQKKAGEEIAKLAKFPSENPNPVLRIAKDGRILYANEASSDLLEFWGCHEDEALPDDWCSLISETHDSGRPNRTEVKCGNTVYSLVLTPVRDSDFLNLYGLDITLRKQAMDEVSESQQRLNSFMNSATDGFILFDSELNYVEINESALEVTGLDRNEMLGKNILDIVPNLKETGRYDKYREVMRTGVPLHIPDLIPHPRFGERHIELKAFRVGNGLGMIFADVTARKLAEQSLKESQRRLLTAQKVGRMGFLDWSLKTNEMFWSDEVYEIYQIDKETELSSIDLAMELVHPDDLEFVQEHLDMAIKGVKRYNIDHRKLRRDGSVIWVHAQADLVRDKDGNPQRMMGTIVDSVHNRM